MNMKQFTGVPADANVTITFIVDKLLKENPYFDANGTRLIGRSQVDQEFTFTFTNQVVLKRPIKF